MTASAAAGQTGRFRHTVALRPADFTLTGHLSNIHFPEMAEIARLAWFRHIPWESETRVPYALVRAMNAEFLGTIRWDVSEVWVDVELRRIGRTSFTLYCAIGVPGDETPKCTVESVHVVTESDEMTTLEISPDERGLLERYLMQETG